MSPYIHSDSKTTRSLDRVLVVVRDRTFVREDGRTFRQEHSLFRNKKFKTLSPEEKCHLIIQKIDRTDLKSLRKINIMNSEDKSM